MTCIWLLISLANIVQRIIQFFFQECVRFMHNYTIRNKS